ncbi:hypothetical protein HZS_4797, partial [Henneguya salminicola]
MDNETEWEWPLPAITDVGYKYLAVLEPPELHETKLREDVHAPILRELS